ncbi:MAG TPA: hypothetical protein VFL47_07350, partial [Flavisolibacter sp.]|nr:hypothetical protein [Flavisolibacter sp.]
AELMTLTLPPARRLRLGRDLVASYPPDLLKLDNADLLALLARIDPTKDSLAGSGATDWSDLRERLHFIADLFRCYHEDRDLLSDAFTPAQVLALKAGRLPEGRL